MLNGKIVLVTGGTGSFGKKFTEIILNRYKVKKLIIFSRDEFKQFEMAQKFPTDKYPCIRYFLGDIRDQERLNRAFHGVDYIIHAAALKHVTAAEYNPFEAVKTNIIGAENIINAAIDQSVKKVMALSTDKATIPVNLYGATKLCSEKLFVAGNSYAGRGSAANTAFSAVRYGNVLGSRGSVVPLFLKQKQTGVITITDKKMTRFWITLEHAVDFVLSCLEKMVGGEIFIPKIPSMNIMDLAEAIAPDCSTKLIGIRPGEKLHEVLVPRDEARNTLEYEDHYIIQPEFDFWYERINDKNSKPVPEDFEYDSENNKHFLTVDEMNKLIGSIATDIET